MSFAGKLRKETIYFSLLRNQKQSGGSCRCEALSRFPERSFLTCVCTHTRSITLLTSLHTYANPPIFNLLCVFFFVVDSRSLPVVVRVVAPRSGGDGVGSQKAAPSSAAQGAAGDNSGLYRCVVRGFRCYTRRFSWRRGLIFFLLFSFFPVVPQAGRERQPGQACS